MKSPADILSRGLAEHLFSVLNICKKCFKRTTQCTCQLLDIQKRDITGTTFNICDICPMEFGFFSQKLLCQVKGDSSRTQDFPELN